MTDWLVSRFIKNSEDVTNARVRTAYGILGSRVGIACNILLFILKFILGVLVNSVSVMADAFNNLSDAVSSVISYVGVKMADKPADEKHPFGHGRMEYIAALFIAFLVVEVGITFCKDAVKRILDPQPLVFYWFVVAGLIISIAVKLWLGFFYRKLGRRISSGMMEASGADAFGDVLATAATLLSLIIFACFGVNLDGVFGLIVSVMIILAGIGIVRDTMEPLIGGAVPLELYHEIEDFVESYDGIEDTHDLIVHNYGPTKSMATIHAEVSCEQDVMVSHSIIDRIERDAQKKLGICLVIHMDPVDTESEEAVLTRHKVVTILQNLDPRLSIHDFRMVNGEQDFHLMFDMVVPFEFDQEKCEDIHKRLENILHLEDTRYRCTITYDKSFVSQADLRK